MEKFQGSLCPIKTGGSRTSQEYLYILCEFVEHSFETIDSKRHRLSNKMYKYSRLIRQPPVSFSVSNDLIKQCFYCRIDFYKFLISLLIFCGQFRFRFHGIDNFYD